MNESNSPHFPYRLIDLTHTLSSESPLWEQEMRLSYRIVSDYEKTGFRVQHVDMMLGSGTHIDAPSHACVGGATVEELALQELVSPGIVIDVSERAHERYSISEKDICQFEDQYGTIASSSIVIFHTGWARRWSEKDKYRNGLVFPSISKEAALLLVKRRVRGVGIDTLSPDRLESDFSVHKILLGANKYIIENVANVHLLPPVGSCILCLPIKVKGATEAPVRLIALLPFPKT